MSVPGAPAGGCKFVPRIQCLTPCLGGLHPGGGMKIWPANQLLSAVLGDLTPGGGGAEATPLPGRCCRPWLAPAEMLPAIEGDHLPRHRRRGEDETARCGDLLRAGAPPQRN